MRALQRCAVAGVICAGGLVLSSCASSTHTSARSVLSADVATLVRDASARDEAGAASELTELTSTVKADEAGGRLSASRANAILAAASKVSSQLHLIATVPTTSSTSTTATTSSTSTTTTSTSTTTTTTKPPPPTTTPTTMPTPTTVPAPPGPGGPGPGGPGQ